MSIILCKNNILSLAKKLFFLKKMEKKFSEILKFLVNSIICINIIIKKNLLLKLAKKTS